MRRSAQAELRSRSGTSALEFALVGGLACILLLGTMEAARYQFTVQALRSLAGEAARLATLSGYANMNAARAPCQGLAGNLTGLSATAPFLNPATLAVTLSGCQTMGAVTMVTVTVTQPFGFSTPIIPVGPLTLTETTQAIFN